jgi:inner membrane protein involved in colicin E2 resistance
VDSFLLLLALSEHLSFELAYVASAAALVALISVYLSGALLLFGLLTVLMLATRRVDWGSVSRLRQDAHGA